MGISLTEDEMEKAFEQVTVDGKNCKDVYLTDKRVESSKGGQEVRNIKQEELPEFKTK